MIKGADYVYIHIYVHIKQIDYSHVHVHVGRKHFGDFNEGITQQLKMVQRNNIIPFHSESTVTVHSNDTNISYCEKTSKIGENPLIIELMFHQNFSIFAMCSNIKQLILVNSPLRAEQNGTNGFVIT